MTNYKEDFAAKVTEVIERRIVDRSERMAVIDGMINDYVKEVGETPDSAQLERLTDGILYEELSDTHPDKITNTEYPFMSEWQLDLRRDRESIEVSANEGTDGKNHRLPTRRRRNGYENWYMDHHAKGRNKERQDQYRKDTAAGEVVTYNLHDTDGEMTLSFVVCGRIGGTIDEQG